MNTIGSSATDGLNKMRILPPPPKSGRAILFTFLLATAIYFVMIFGTLAQLESLAEAKPFDMRPAGYSFESATKFLSALGTDGRRLYLWRQIPLDMVYPALFAVCSAGAITWFSESFRPAIARWTNVVAPIAYLAALADYIENILIVGMLNSWPELSTTVVSSASLATMVKSGLTTVVIMTAILSMLTYLINRFHQR